MPAANLEDLGVLADVGLRSHSQLPVERVVPLKAADVQSPILVGSAMLQTHRQAGLHQTGSGHSEQPCLRAVRSRPYSRLALFAVGHPSRADYHRRKYLT